MRTKSAKKQALMEYEIIAKIIKKLDLAEEEGEEMEKLREQLQEIPLRVSVRSGYQNIGEKLEPSEYNILLCIEGPAVRITGALNEYFEPSTASLEAQDWFTPWEEILSNKINCKILLDFTRQFYFGG